MPEVLFTQFVRPDGHPREVSIDRPQEVADKAKEIEDRGYCLESEVLMSGQVSLTIFDPDDERDLAIELVPNGPEVPEAVDKLIMEFELK
jgi:hypothetical protein